MQSSKRNDNEVLNSYIDAAGIVAGNNVFRIFCKMGGEFKCKQLIDSFIHEFVYLNRLTLPNHQTSRWVNSILLET